LPALAQASIALWVNASSDMRVSGASLLISGSTFQMSLSLLSGPFP